MRHEQQDWANKLLIKEDMIKQKSCVHKIVHISDPRGEDFAMCGKAYSEDITDRYIKTKDKVNCDECLDVLNLYASVISDYVKTDLNK